MLAIQSKLLLQNLLAWQLYFTLVTEKRRCVKPFLGTHTSSLPVCFDMKTSWDDFFFALKVLTLRCHNCIYFQLVVQKSNCTKASQVSSFSVKGFGPILDPHKFSRSFSVFAAVWLVQWWQLHKKGSLMIYQMATKYTHSGLWQICLDKKYLVQLLL